MTPALLALSIALAAQPTVRAGRDGPPLPKGTPESVGLAPERLDRLSQAIAADVAAGRLPGAVVAIARRGSLVYFETFGYRDAAARESMPHDAIFRVSSMTKPFVSVAAMILVEEGKLQLTDPVSIWFPEFREMRVSVRRPGGAGWELVPAERQITVHDLLRHTSGLTYASTTTNESVRDAYVAARLVEWRALSPAEEVAALDFAPLAWQPGTRFEDGLSTDLLGRVIEAVSGMRLRDFLERRLFRPLGMSDTGFVVPPGKHDRIAEPLRGGPDAPFDPRAEPGNDAGGSGAVSTALDYLRFAQMLLDGGRLGGTRILSRTTVELMASDHLGWRTVAASPSEALLGVEGYGFGLGLLVRTEPGLAGVSGSVGEFMWAGGYGTFFWVDPKERLVAVVMTQVAGPPRLAHRRLWKQLVQQAIAD